VDPRIGKIVFTMCIFIILLGCLVLPFLDPFSAEFVADVLSITIAGISLSVLVWQIRKDSSARKSVHMRK